MAACAACITTSNTMRPFNQLPDGQSARVGLSGGGGFGVLGYQAEGDLWAGYEFDHDLELLGYQEGLGIYLSETEGWSYSARTGILLRQRLEMLQQTHLGWEVGAAYLSSYGSWGDEHVVGVLLGLPVYQEITPGLVVYSEPSVYIDVVVSGDHRPEPYFLEPNVPIGFAWLFAENFTLVGEAAYHGTIGGVMASVGVVGHF